MVRIVIICVVNVWRLLMFALNFKKDWRMNKSKFITFFSIIFLIFLANMIFYLLIKYVNMAGNTENILRGIWMLLAGLASTLGEILVIVFIYFLIKRDLGKNNIHNTIFTPQNLLSWLLPKIVYVFIIQGLFSILNLVYLNCINDFATSIMVNGQIIELDLKYYLISFVTGTFNFGFFALMTLLMALFYSFRNKGLSWLLIVITAIIYFISSQAYSTYQIIQNELYGTKFDLLNSSLIDFGIKNTVGLIFIFISLYLFDKKIEY